MNTVFLPVWGVQTSSLSLIPKTSPHLSENVDHFNWTMDIIGNELDEELIGFWRKFEE